MEKQLGKSMKKLAKNLKKGVDIKNALWYYIQVDAIRQQNISQGRQTLEVCSFKTEH